jgi:WD40 repeat protein
MGETLEARIEGLDHVLRERGRPYTFDAFVVACAFDRAGRHAAFALGDGTLRIVPVAEPGEARTVEAHDGGVLALAAHPAGGFVSGGDDGRLLHVATDGAVGELAAFGAKWVEQVAAFADAKIGLIACAVGKTLHLFDAQGAALKRWAHPSTVTGIAFDAKGKRVGASHYGGASLWFVASRSETPRVLEWKGSHTGIAISPDGDSVVTTMQENALHGWRLSDSQHMRMSGYPAKPQSLGFTRNGRWLASAGAEAIVLWPFFGGGPMGKAPSEMPGVSDAICTRVACNPAEENVAAGFADGLAIVGAPASERVLPICKPGRGAVSALGWSPAGETLALGTETGFAALVDFRSR